MVAAWHFTGDTLRDGRSIPAVGEWLVHEGPIEICCTGLHASKRLIDALAGAPGHMLHRVTMRGIEDTESDKLVARERRIDWSINAEPVLRTFALRCALDALPFWPDAPDIVRQYLETGDETFRTAAKDAAWNATKTAAWDATRAAAWEAAWDAAKDAAWDATRAAAWAAAWDAAKDAAWDAAWAAARAAAWAAARASARDAKLDTYNSWLTEMVEAAREDV